MTRFFCIIGQWINTANIDADVDINSTHIVETWHPDVSRWRKAVYVCQEKRDNRYLMARFVNYIFPYKTFIGEIPNLSAAHHMYSRKTNSEFLRFFDKLEQVFNEFIRWFHQFRIPNL